MDFILLNGIYTDPNIDQMLAQLRLNRSSEQCLRSMFRIAIITRVRCRASTNNKFIMDSAINRSNVGEVFDHPRVPPEQKLALRCFFKAYYGKDEQGEWMRRQHGWRQAAALLASACTRYPNGNLRFPGGARLVDGEPAADPYRILLCGFRRKLCGRGNYCRRCALDRIDLAWSEFLPAWRKAGYWYSMVLALDRRAGDAGIHLGDGAVDDERRSQTVYRPFEARHDGTCVLHTGPELHHITDSTRRAFFETAKDCCEAKLFNGAFARFEVAFSFWRGTSNYDLWSQLRHRVDPHLNLLLNADRPLDADSLLATFKTLINNLRRYLAQEYRWSYPDMWVAPVLGQAQMRRWIAYMLKAWRFEDWYREGLNRRCDQREINLCFDQIVFENGSFLANAKTASRRFGNLRFDPHHQNRYIARRIPPMLTSAQWDLARDPDYIQAHPELEDALEFWAEKRFKRRGQRNVPEDGS